MLINSLFYLKVHSQSIHISLWENIDKELKNLFSSDIYDMWFDKLVCTEESDSKIVLTAPNEFNAIWIENNYLDIISKLARSYSGDTTEVVVEVQRQASRKSVAADSGHTPAHRYKKPDADAPRQADTATDKIEKPQATRFSLNPKNTFSNFVVGPCNQLSHAASMAIANAPGRAYNPLFVYGDTGLGKTHLMHAVAHQMLANKPDARIAYVSTEKFTNEFIHAIRENKLVKFRKYYRTVDALLIDDIHFLAGKESTQEEFFHTFNDLFESGRQIFLASDRPANEIERLENRLISRFQWGMVTDIQTPVFETRVAILRNKAAAMNLKIDPEIIDFLARRISRNIRRMEGALTRIASYNFLIDQKLDIHAIERLLSDLLQEENITRVTVDQIQKKVAEFYKIRFSELIGRRRTNDIVFPRQVAMYISRTLTSDPLKSIGEAFGGRDHGTVIHACKQVENIMEQDSNVKGGVDYLIQQLSRGV